MQVTTPSTTLSQASVTVILAVPQAELPAISVFVLAEVVADASVKSVPLSYAMTIFHGTAHTAYARKSPFVLTELWIQLSTNAK